MSQPEHDQQTFGNVADQFVDYYETLRGHIRQELTREQLTDYLGRVPLWIADIGGGDGRDTLWLAAQGHNVVMADPSDEMIAKAETALKAADPKVAQRVKLLKGEAEDVLKRCKPGSFDMALSHGVLMYLVRPELHLQDLSRLCKPGGLVSLLTKGYGGTLMRLAAAGDVEASAHLVHSGQSINALGVITEAYDPGQIENMIEDANLRVVDWFGVRVLFDQDQRQLQDVAPRELAEILKLERNAATDLSLRGVGQMLHFIAEKV